MSSCQRSHRLPGSPRSREQSTPSQTGRPAMQPSFIPMLYVSGAVRAGLALPRMSRPTSHLSCVGGLGPGAALSAAASGMMALMDCFRHSFRDGAIQRDRLFPWLVLGFARDRTLCHALGAFTATLSVRSGSPRLIAAHRKRSRWSRCIGCMLMFSRLIKRLGDLQIGNALHLVANRDDRHRRHVRRPADRERRDRITKTVKYFGKPRVIARLGVNSLIALARRARGTIVWSAQSATRSSNAVLLHVHGSAPRPSISSRTSGASAPPSSKPVMWPTKTSLFGLSSRRQVGRTI